MAHDDHNHRVTTTKERRPAGGRFLPVVGLLLVSALLLAVAACSNGETTDPTSGSDLEAAPEFEFTLYQGEGELGGSELSMSDLQGKPVVLNFWAGLCPPCRAEMPDFQAFHDENRNRLTVLGIDVGQFTNLGSQEDARLLLTDLGVTYPAGYTTDSTIMRRYEVLGMPTTVFINSRGEVFRNWGGILDHEKLQEIADEMLAEETG